MASLAIAAAGAALSGGLGFGPQIGFLIGSVIGTLLFPPPSQNQVQEGPRLGDLSVTSSTYGQAIPLGYGTIRMSGNMIWSAGIREVRHEETRGGGKGGLGGGPKQTQITYTYFINMALAFSATQATDVIRMWADGKLILDKTGNTNTRLSGLSYRFYQGTEEQLPDSIIEAQEGAGNVPGHRGLCYIVFDNLPLEDFGNRVPNITAELAFRAETENIIDGGTELDPPLSFQNNFMTVDYTRRRIYHLEGSTPTLKIFNFDTLNEYRRVTGLTFSGAGTGNHAGRFTGNLYTGNGTRRLIRKWNPESFAETGSFGDDALGFGNSPDHFEGPLILLEAQTVRPKGAVRNFLAQVGFITGPIGLLDADNMTYIWHESSPGGGLDVLGLNASPFQQAGSATFIYSLGDDSDNNSPTEIWELNVSNGADYDADNMVTSGVSFLQVGTISPDTWSNDGGGETIGPIIDLEDDGLIFLKRVNADSCYVFKWIKGQGVVWRTLVPDTTAPIQTIPISVNSVAESGRFGWVANDRAALIDTSTGNIIISGLELFPFDIDTVQDTCFWDVSSEAIVTQNTGGFPGEIVRLFLNRTTGLGVPLRTIVEDLSQRAGYNVAEDLDTTALTDNVRGYVVGRQMSYRQAIEPLAQAFFFDGVESDDKVKFVKRGGSAIASFVQSDLAEQGENNEVIPETRTQEVELPERISVLFLNQDADYEQGTQSAKRVRKPQPTMRSRVEESVSFSIVFNPTEAAQIAEILLYSSWQERTVYKWKAGWEYLALDPTDIVTVTLDDGTLITANVGQITVGADLSLEFEGVSEKSTTFTSNATGQGSLSTTNSNDSTVVSTATRFFIFNIPLLRDIDDTGGNSHRVYYGMNGYTEGWDGGSLLQSRDDGATFNEISRALDGVEWGTVSNRLPATDVPFQIDENTVLTVFMQVGELESVTEAQFLNDESVALVGDPLTNVWEVICYRDVTEIADGVYEVSRIIRGKRGTDFFANDHENNELFLPITRNTLFAYLLNLSDRGVELPYKGVGFDQIQEEVGSDSFTCLGRDLFPYAPVLLDAVVDGGSNINFSWVRRTRIGGGLVDGTGSVPLSESTENYVVDVYSDATATTVLRTLVSTTPTVQYDNADIIADFGGVPSEITFGVFQLSSVVGPGFEGRATITL